MIGSFLSINTGIKLFLITFLERIHEKQMVKFLMHKFWGSNQHFIQRFGFTEVLVINISYRIYRLKSISQVLVINISYRIYRLKSISQVWFINQIGFLKFGFTCLVYQIDWFPQVWSHRFGLLDWFPIWFDVSGSALHGNSTFCVYIS